AAPCSGTPVAGTVSGPLGALCSGSPFSLSLSGFTLAAGISYQWQSKAASASTWSNITGATSSSYNQANGVAVATDYRVIETCATSGLSDTSNVVFVTVAPLFAGGTYTINPGIPASSTNFQSMGDAVNAISCGIGGPIVFNMAAGNTFNEQVTLPSTIGTSATNTVKFNGNGDTVNFTGTAILPWTIGLNGADYISFNNLVVRGNGTNAYVVHLWNDADYNTFTNCTIIAPENGISTTQIPFSISGSPTSITSGASGSYNTLDSCTIISGYYNVYLYGNSSAPSVGNQILNSTLQDCYMYGSYNFHQSGLLIKNNLVERPTRTSLSTFYGIYLNTGCINSTIEQNRMRNQFGGNPVYSGISYNIYASSTSATVGTENKIINNVIGNINGNSSVYGIYMPSAIHTQVYFNTISIDNTAATTGTVYGIYSTGTTGGIDIKNNNIVVTQGGSGTKYCLYYSAATGKTSNNNNLYMASTSGSNYIGYLSAAQSTLANWQAAAGAGFDLQSVSINPVFAGPATGNFTPTNAAFNDLGTPIAGITTDFLGATRSTTTPDMGAYEFSVAACTGTVTAGTASVPSPTVCGGTNILLEATGATAPAGGLTGNWQSRPTAGGPWTDITGATMPSYNLGSGVNVETDFRFWMTCSNNGSSDTSNVVSVTINPANQCYCTPGGSGTSYYMTNFNTTGAAQNVNVNNTALPAGGYKDNTATDTVSQVQSSTVNVSFTGAPSNTYGFAVWVDWNQNGTFEVSEKMFNTSSYSASATGTFTVPVTALAGTTRMRIGSHYLNSAGPDPCENSTYTQFEDFAFQVVALQNCSGIVSAGTVTGPGGVCATNSFTLSTAGATLPNNGLAGNWQSAPSAAGPWTDITGETSTSLTVATGITTATSYRYWIACSFSSSSDTSNVVTLSINPANQCYCTPTYTNTSDYLSAFSTTGGTQNISYTGTSSSGGYQNLTTQAVDQDQGQIINLSTTYVGGSNTVMIWVDYNGDGMFDDITERMYNYYSSAATNTGSFTVPSTVAAGQYRMRVRSGYGNVTGMDACNNQSFGSAVDFTLNVTALVACSGTVNAGTVTGPLEVCAASSFTLTSAGVTMNSSGLVGNWQSAPSPIGPWTNITGETSTSLTVASGITTATSYRYWIACSNSLSADTSNIVHIYITSPTYAVYNNISYQEGFENWISACATNDIPSNYWTNNPINGNNSWRRNDQGNDASWSSTGGAYTPTFSEGANSARFHSYNATSGLIGTLSFHVDMTAASGNTDLSFDYINTSGSDVLKVFLSTDGGVTETQLGGNQTNASTWTKKHFTINSNAANTIIRWEATSDYGGTDIGVDNFQLNRIPDNDQAPQAITINVNASCTSGDNTFGSMSNNEPFASCSGTNGYRGLWYKFIAPTSGNVKISSDYAGGTLTNSKLGLFSTTNVNDYSSFSIIACDEDNGVIIPNNAIIYANNLTPGGTYYIQLDGSTGSSFGTFCLSVEELTSAMLSDATNCESMNNIPVGNNSSYTGQLSLVDNSAKLIAIVRNPAGGAASNYSFSQNINSGPVRMYSQSYYLDRNFHINNAIATNVEVSLFFLNSELNNLIAVDPNATGIADLSITKVTNAHLCQADVFLDGTQTNISASASHTYANGYASISFTTPGFSNFYLSSSSALPIYLQYFNGKIVENTNELNWKSEVEKNANQTIIERSADGYHFYAIGNVKSKNQNGAEYKFVDTKPIKGENYYRLSLESSDSKTQYSSIIKLNNGNIENLTLIATPNPVKNIVKINILGSITKAANISIVDVLGRKVYSQEVTQSEFNIDMSNLKDGIYMIQYKDGKREQFIKLIKQ
ncbi:MAG TPA: GEVED domain-containing protein, partial [Edaphocola sp.]|nr:GEVED domain-containing protein [Edaphocola sp.]